MSGNASVVALTPGQKLWWVCLNRSPGTKRDPGHEVTVMKVGRRWVVLDNGHRIDVDTWTADGGGYVSPGRCWPSEAAYVQETELEERWGQFHQYVATQYRAPAGCTKERIDAALRILHGAPEHQEDLIARLRETLEAIKQISRPTSDVWDRADRGLRMTEVAFPSKAADPPLHPCDCTGYNGGQCYNCLNGFHVGCPFHCTGSQEPLRVRGMRQIQKLPAR